MESNDFSHDIESLKRGFRRIKYMPETSTLNLLITLLERGVESGFIAAENDERLADDLSDIRFVENLMGEIKIMALFTILDVTALKAAKETFKELRLFEIKEDDQGNAKHKHKYTFHQVMGELRIDYKEIAEYKFYNEMRLINNAIKHFGFAHDELAVAYPKNWKYGQELLGLSKHYDRLKVNTTNFYIKVIELLISK